MFTVNVDKECGCFNRSELENNKSFENNDDALIQAQSMLNHMNEKFCGKHGFSLSEDGKNFNISMNAPQQAQASSGGCCGGGHCS
ncbi:MAG TPA: hypothetical protein EYH57_00950 [Sulfurovum sp.]|nr:hypothetical protein [Sulfurovum sp.]